MKRSAKIHKTANILLGLLISASYAANAMEGKEEDKESTAWIRAEVARVLENFQRNMNTYYEHTGNPKRITIADEETKAKQTEREAAENAAAKKDPDEELREIERGTLAEKATYGLFRVAKESMDPASEVRYFVKTGTDVNAYDRYPILSGGSSVRNYTPLHYAAYWGKDRAIVALRYWGADANAKVTMPFGDGVFENTALHLAAKGGHVEAIKALCKPLENHLGLLTAGADVNAKDYYLAYTPMHSAAVNGHVEAIEALHSSGGDVNAQDDRGFSPLLLAVSKGYREDVKVLLDLGAKDYDLGHTPMHSAAANGNVTFIKWLHQFGEDVNAQDDQEISPLFLAAEKEHTEAVKVLLDLGANVNAKDKNGNTVLDTIRTQRNKLQRTNIPLKTPEYEVRGIMDHIRKIDKVIEILEKSVETGK